MSYFIKIFELHQDFMYNFMGQVVLIFLIYIIHTSTLAHFELEIHKDF